MSPSLLVVLSLICFCSVSCLLVSLSPCLCRQHGARGGGRGPAEPGGDLRPPGAGPVLSRGSVAGALRPPQRRLGRLSEEEEPGEQVGGNLAVTANR